jgi:hypothetical protein
MDLYGQYYKMSILRVNKFQNIAGTTLNVPIQVQHYQNNTRTALSTGVTSYTLWSGITFNKLQANSYLIVTGQLVFSNAYSYNMGYWWQIGNSGKRYDSIFQCHYPSDTTRAVAIKIGWFINGIYTTADTGLQNISIGWNSFNGGSDSPGTVWNPNVSDDGRSQQHSSDLTIMEVVS